MSGLSGGDTIYALSSAPGPAGVAVVRVSGAATNRIIQEIAGDLPQPRRAVLRGLRDPADGGLIDRALVLRFDGPASFTGEDCAEFHIHGGRAVLEALFAALGRFQGARLAEPGEFSRRAFVNGKLELTEAEGIADLVAAETDAQRRAALAQADGALARLHGGWRERLIRQLAHVEAWLDFPDEDLPDDVLDGLRSDLGDLTGAVTAHLADARRGERLRDGLTVAIVGPPNAGKSTLLNALAQRDVAIVSETPGTTRDVLEAHLDLGGWPVVLIDTAGIRETEDAVEKEGVRRARDRAAKADLVLSLRAAGTAASEADFESYSAIPDDSLTPVWPETILVLSQVDRANSDLPGGSVAAVDIRLSARTGEGMDRLLALLSERSERLMSAGGAALPTRLRHRQCLEECVRLLDRAASWTAELPPELLAEDLRLALRALGRIAGSVDVEDLLDVIFREFCIGK